MMREQKGPLATFQTFGDLLKYTRRKAMLTQSELSIAVGYSVSQISRLESNLRTVDRVSLAALFVPALHLEDEPETIQKLMELAEAGRSKAFDPEMAPRQAAVAEAVGYPVVKEAAAYTSNLPVELSSFIGREGEITRIIQLLTTETRKGRGPVRLLTLTGTGGCGKTRLALRAAKELLPFYPHGVWQAEMAHHSDPSLVPQAIASALGLMVISSRPLVDALANFLRDRQLLLVLDNCEHLLEPISHLVKSLLQTCPRLQILATSREPLGLPGEVNFRVSSMSFPSGELPADVHLADVSAFESVQLFIERAQSVEPSFEVRDEEIPSLVQICRGLDGIPLAIELAAARVSQLSIGQIVGRLEDGLRLLADIHRTAVPRHQSLQAAIDWSYDLLDDSESLLLRRLAVFADGCSLEAVETICGWGDLPAKNVLDLLAAVVDKSLATTNRQPGMEVRYQLQEVLRQYLMAKLVERSEEDEIRKRYQAYYVMMAENAWLALRGPDQMRWLKWLDQEHDNLRAVLGQSISAGDAENGLRLAGALAGFWDLRGYHQEGCRWLVGALRLVESTPVNSWRARAFLSAGTLEIKLGDLEAGRAHLDESLSIYRAINDPEGIVGALNNLAILCWLRGDAPATLARLEESQTVLKDVKNLALQAETLYHSSRIKKWHDLDFTGARALLEQSIACARSAGDRIYLTGLLNDLSWLDWDRGEIGKARSRLAENIDICRAAGDKQTLYWSLSILAFYATFQGDFPAAREALAEMLTLARSMVNWNLVANAHQQTGFADFYQGDLKGAHASFEAAIQLYEDYARGNAGWAISKLGDVFFAEGQYQQSAALQEESLSLLEAQYNEVTFHWALRGLGNVAQAKGDYAGALVLYRRGLAMVRKRMTLPDFPILLEPMAKAAAGVGDALRAARLLGASHALRKQMGMPIPPVEVPEYEKCLAEVQAALSPEAFAEAWAEGKVMTAGQVADYGMADT